MQRKNMASVSSRIAVGLAGILCAFALLVGCAQQPQATGTEQQVEQRQGNSTSAEGEQERADALAKGRLEEATPLEPAITKDLQAAEDDLARLDGLDFRFKSQESLARKIISDAHEKGVSLDEAAAQINDVLRYTIRIEPSVYVSKATEYLKTLEAKGYSVVKFKNMWNGDIYKGVNTQIEAPTGFVFELQVHTPDSLAMREKTHKYYEISRDEKSTKEEVDDAVRTMTELVKELEIPEGALEFTWE